MSPLHAVLPRCPKTGLALLTLDGSEGLGNAAPVVFYLNGIGLDAEGYRPGLEGLIREQSTARFARHVAITVPGFEDDQEHRGQAPLSIAAQALKVADCIRHHLSVTPATTVLLYAFSFGSDLAVEVLEQLQGDASVPLRRAILAEMNVQASSCFITRRLSAAYAEATHQGAPHAAYPGFLAKVTEAHEHGELNSRLWQDMLAYCQVIARKHWPQLAHSAAEASANPEARVQRFLKLSGAFPDTRFELCFTDRRDLARFQAHMQESAAPLGHLRVMDHTAHDHFRAISPQGVRELLEGRLPEARPRKAN